MKGFWVLCRPRIAPGYGIVRKFRLLWYRLDSINNKIIKYGRVATEHKQTFDISLNQLLYIHNFRYEYFGCNSYI